MSPHRAPASPDLNTVREDFIIETYAVMWTHVSEAFPPCQENKLVLAHNLFIYIPAVTLSPFPMARV